MTFELGADERVSKQLWATQLLESRTAWRISGGVSGRLKLTNRRLYFKPFFTWANVDPVLQPLELQYQDMTRVEVETLEIPGPTLGLEPKVLAIEVNGTARFMFKVAGFELESTTECIRRRCPHLENSKSG